MIRIGTTSRALTALLAVFSAVCVATVLIADHLDDLHDDALTRYHESTVAATALAQGSDLLTREVRAFAATGEETYREAYRTEVRVTRSRDKAVERLRGLGANEAELKLLETAKRNSDALINLETRAFEAGGRGDRAEAIALVYGPDYRAAKDSIMGPIGEAMASLQRRQNAESILLKRKAELAREIAVGASVLNLIAVLLVTLVFLRGAVVRPLERMYQQARQLLAGDRESRLSQPGAAQEISELASALEEFRRSANELDAQRAALQKASEEQDAILETATSGMALIRDRILLRCNRRLHEMLGWPAGELVGQATRAWYPDETADAVGAKPYEAIWRGEAHSREQQLKRRDGSLFWARLTGKAIDVNDRAKGTVWVIDDISAEHAAAAAMAEARRLAEDAAREKADFLASMSHEIRTPMNAVIGMTHLLGKTELAPRQRDYLTRIEDAGEHLLGVINDILDFSKAEAGMLRIEQAEFDLERLMARVTSQLLQRADAKGLEITVDVAADVPPMPVGDALRIGQILLNYGSNALKFTAKGEVNFIVRAEQVGEGEAVLRFAVRDSGVGLTAEQQSRLFQRFQQAEESTSRRFGGTGLGLAISKLMAELMGGQVGVESEPGKGSTFWFTARVGIGAARVRAFVPRPDLRGRRVLVVDDNNTARAIHHDLLESMTFRVGEAPSGQRAIDAVREADARGDPYAIVFIDWQMPELNGIDTARQIRALGLRSPPEFVLVTAYGGEALMDEALANGFKAFLVKPVSPSTLSDTAIQVIGREAPVPPAEPKAEEAQELSPALKGARVLLVEDNELNQEVGRELLEMIGVKVDVAENGEVAVAKVRAGDYDLVFMDMQMPVMDGLDATVAIRKLPGRQKLPIVAMTANAMQQDRERCFAAGMDDFIPKPIDPDELWAVLQRRLKPAAA